MLCKEKVWSCNLIKLAYYIIYSEQDNKSHSHEGVEYKNVFCGKK